MACKHAWRTHVDDEWARCKLCGLLALEGATWTASDLERLHAAQTCAPLDPQPSPALRTTIAHRVLCFPRLVWTRVDSWDADQDTAAAARRRYQTDYGCRIGHVLHWRADERLVLLGSAGRGDSAIFFDTLAVLFEARRAGEDPWHAWRTWRPHSAGAFTYDREHQG